MSDELTDTEIESLLTSTLSEGNSNQLRAIKEGISETINREDFIDGVVNSMVEAFRNPSLDKSYRKGREIGDVIHKIRENRVKSAQINAEKLSNSCYTLRERNYDSDSSSGSCSYSSSDCSTTNIFLVLIGIIVATFGFYKSCEYNRTYVNPAVVERVEKEEREQNEFIFKPVPDKIYESFDRVLHNSSPTKLEEVALLGHNHCFRVCSTACKETNRLLEESNYGHYTTEPRGAYCRCRCKINIAASTIAPPFVEKKEITTSYPEKVDSIDDSGIKWVRVSFQPAY